MSEHEMDTEIHLYYSRWYSRTKVREIARAMGCSAKFLADDGGKGGAYGANIARKLTARGEIGTLRSVLDFAVPSAAGSRKL